MENTAIRMILCDVDGTLLSKEEAIISKSVIHAIEHAANKGIHIVIASGRSYNDLMSLFSSVSNLVTFICSDGALIVKNEEIIHQTVINPDRIKFLMSKIKLNNQESLILYGKSKTFCIGNNSNLENTVQITSPDDLNDNVYKIAFRNLSSLNCHNIKTYGKQCGDFTKIYEDDTWIEFVAHDVNKGVAVQRLQHLFQVSPLETAAFGDNINDIEMLRQARLSFASPTAISEVKRMCKFTTSCVTDEIIKLIDKQ